MEERETTIEAESPKSDTSAIRPPPLPSGNWVVFWALQAVGFVVCNLILNIQPDGSGDFFVPALFGIYYGQIVLASVLTVFAPWGILTRLTVLPLWIAAETFVAALLARHGPEPGEGLLFAGLTVFTWMLVQIPFWGTRRLLRLRLRPRQADPASSTAAGSEQFSVRQLLIFTLAVAVILGVGKAIVSQEAVQRFFRISAEDAMTFILFVTAIVSSGLVVVHVGLQPYPSAATVLTGVALVIGILLTLRFVFAYWVVTGGPPDAYAVLSNSVAGQAIWIAISLLGLRRGGWRLLGSG